MKLKSKTLHRIFTCIRLCVRLIIYFLLLSAAVLCIDYVRRFLIADYYNSRHWEVSVSTDSFSESREMLSNPDKGTYRIYGFYISDNFINYNTLVAEKFKNDHSNTLAMVQINLADYRTGEISQIGLEHIESLFRALRDITDKRFLIRFLYDWDGKNLSTEPESLDIILGHIRQLEPVLRANSDQIFVLQGLFIGNWGEMNGSKYLNQESYRALSDTLASVTDESTFLSVRMPAHWRSITGIADFTLDTLRNHPFAWRFSLYNDGIMGNEGDYGTYGTRSRVESGDLSLWNRAEELAFQEQLCLYVPNGGEVIINNPVNDFENALPTLRQMHVTYINEGYDTNVFKKWEQTIISDGSVYDGMDGYTYIKRHLGYRIYIDSADMAYQVEDDSLSCTVHLKNTGFAPLYGSKEARLILYHTANNAYYVYPFKEDITALSRTEDFSLQLQIPLTKLPTGTYTASFQLWDNNTDGQLQLAVETPQTDTGYLLGSFVILENEETPAYPALPDLPFDLDSKIEELFRPPFGGSSGKPWTWLDHLYRQKE